MSQSKAGPPADEANFIETLENLDDGKVLIKITKEMAAVIKAVAATKKKGDVTLKLKVSYASGHISVAPEIKATVPKEGNEATLFYATEDGALTKDNPAQPTLRNVDVRPSGPMRVVKEN